jgi:hypothetical protein
MCIISHIYANSATQTCTHFVIASSYRSGYTNRFVHGCGGVHSIKGTRSSPLNSLPTIEMDLRINTMRAANVSKLSRARLLEMQDHLESDDILERQELIAIGQELVATATDPESISINNIGRLLYMLEAGKPVKLREVQNVFLDYVERALKGKVGGKTRKGRKCRKSRKYRKSRKHI